VPAELQVGRGQIFDRREPRLEQAGPLMIGVLTAYSGERGSLPQRERDAQLGRLGLAVARVAGPARGADPALEVGEVEEARLWRQRIAAGTDLITLGGRPSPSARRSRETYERIMPAAARGAVSPQIAETN
jgi:hypothetical protein